MEEIKVIRESQVRMEQDLKHHIKRTELLEEKHEKQYDPMYRAFIGVKWSIGAILTLSLLITAIAKIKGIL